MSRADHQLKVRVPADVLQFLAKTAQDNGSSMNFEIVRSVRERIDRQTAKSEGASAPTPAPSVAT